MLESAPRWSVVFLLAVLLIVALAIIEKLYRSERSHVAAEAQLKSQLAKANKRAHDLEPHLIAWNKTQSELDAQDVRGTDVIDQYKKIWPKVAKKLGWEGQKTDSSGKRNLLEMHDQIDSSAASNILSLVEPLFASHDQLMHVIVIRDKQRNRAFVEAGLKRRIPRHIEAQTFEHRFQRSCSHLCDLFRRNSLHLSVLFRLV